MAVKDAYALFHHEEAQEDKMRIFEGSVYTGMFGKKKIGQSETPNFIKYMERYTRRTNISTMDSGVWCTGQKSLQANRIKPWELTLDVTIT